MNNVLKKDNNFIIHNKEIRRISMTEDESNTQKSNKILRQVLYILVFLLSASNVILLYLLTFGCNEKENYENTATSSNAYLMERDVLIKKINSLEEEINQMVQKNRELVEDNIELQNTLKLAAEAGIKPQNYKKFSGFSIRTELERGEYVGRFIGTAYTPSEDECGNNLGITYSGEPIMAGISLAVDLEHWPIGTIFFIKGLGYGVAMDTGEAIKGRNRFDFAVFDKRFAKLLGYRSWDVYLVKIGDGNIDFQF